MKFILAFLALCLHQVLSQGCTDTADWCGTYISVCHDKRFVLATQKCPKTCINMCKNPPRPQNQPSICGNPQVQASRVIAGEDAKAGAWPWQILLTYKGAPKCGGSIISSRWVVTAAHCVYRNRDNWQDFKVRVGEHNWRVKEGNEKDFRIEKLFVHPSYNRHLDNDIALLKLDAPVMFGKYVSPVCLPSQGVDVPVGTECFITGWGKVKHPGYMNTILQQGKLPVISSSVCNRLNFPVSRIPITEGMVCAGYGSASRLSGCHGDSGGPFVCRDKQTNSFVLQGAVSWGSRRCDTKESYSVFARVSEFRNWIDVTMFEN